MSKKDKYERYAEAAEAAFQDNWKIRGHLAELSGGRIVFIGKHPDYADSWIMRFQNADGEQSGLMLTQDAMAMLVQLYNRPDKGTETFPLTISTTWQVNVVTENKS